MGSFSNFNVVLLAAGMSQRMGARNKLFLTVDGESLVRRSAKIYSSLGMNVVVVLGHDSKRVASAVSGLDVTTVLNADYKNGQQSSVETGFKALNLPGTLATLVALSDQPMLTSNDIAGFCKSFLDGPRDKILVPYWEQSRGNPVLFPDSFGRMFAAEGKPLSCREYIDLNPNLVSRYAAPNTHFTDDIDTLCDMERLLPSD